MIIARKSKTMVRGRLSQVERVKKGESYALLKDENNTEKISVPDILIKNIDGRHLNFAVENSSDDQLKLKKGDVLTDVFAISEVTEDDVQLHAVAELSDTAPLNTRDMNEQESRWLNEILKDYDDAMRMFPEN